ncbi:MAG: hypothetical protein HXX16_03150 [Bacteroidales bacterium]|nr:hypothetical protein [Bacteroidales bacterium]
MEELKFNLLLAALSLAVIIVGLIIWLIISGVLKGFENNKKGKTKGWPYALFALIFILITPSTVFVYRYFDFKIPNKPIELTSLIKNDNDELMKLSEQMSIVTKALNNPKDLTLKQIESILTNSLDYSKKVNIILSRNDSIIGQLRTQVEIERKHAEESKRIAENLKSLTKEQLESIKLIITMDAKESSSRSFIYGILFSIPVGFFMSLLSTFVYRKWGSSAKKGLENKFDN